MPRPRRAIKLPKKLQDSVIEKDDVKQPKKKKGKAKEPDNRTPKGELIHGSFTEMVEELGTAANLKKITDESKHRTAYKGSPTAWKIITKYFEPPKHGWKGGKAKLRKGIDTSAFLALYRWHSSPDKADRVKVSKVINKLGRAFFVNSLTGFKDYFTQVHKILVPEGYSREDSLEHVHLETKEKEAQDKQAAKRVLEKNKNQISVEASKFYNTLKKASQSTNIFDRIITVQMSTGLRSLGAINGLISFSDTGKTMKDGTVIIRQHGKIKTREQKNSFAFDAKYTVDKPLQGISFAQLENALAAIKSDVTKRMDGDEGTPSADQVKGWYNNPLNRRIGKYFPEKKVKKDGSPANTFVITSHVLRSMYAMISAKFHKPDGVSAGVFVNSILNHREDSSTVFNYSGVQIKRSDAKANSDLKRNVDKELGELKAKDEAQQVELDTLNKAEQKRLAVLERKKIVQIKLRGKDGKIHSLSSNPKERGRGQENVERTADAYHKVTGRYPSKQTLRREFKYGGSLVTWLSKQGKTSP